MARTGNNNHCLFGPVNSRRLGVSLGIDLMKFKTCTLNCVFCECGATTMLTGRRQIGAPTAQVRQELAEFFARSPHFDSLQPRQLTGGAAPTAQLQPDVLTFSGGGEPTLAINLGEVIQDIKKTYPQKLCLLTNSTLLADAQVRQEILPVDIIIPSFNAVSPDVFRQINRPADGVTPEQMRGGLLALKQEYSGKLLLEIFIVPGLNDTDRELRLLRDFARELKPDGIQLNSLDRRGAEDWVRPAPAENMQKIKDFFGEFNTNYYLRR